MTTSQKLHGAIFAAVMVALLAGGWVLGGTISQSPTSAATRTLPAQTIVHTHTRVLTKIVKGKVVRLKSGQRVVLVSRVVIHNLRCHPSKRHHCVRRVVVPAHTIALRRATPIHAAVAIAAPLMPVTVYATVTEPAQTVTLPAQTVTQTQTDTATETTTVTETVTVPLLP